MKKVIVVLLSFLVVSVPVYAEDPDPLQASIYIDPQLIILITPAGLINTGFSNGTFTIIPNTQSILITDQSISVTVDTPSRRVSCTSSVAGIESALSNIPIGRGGAISNFNQQLNAINVFSNSSTKALYINYSNGICWSIYTRG